MAVSEAVPQHLVALKRANRVRIARAELRRRIAAGETTVADVIAEVPWEAESMTVFDLLVAQHRWGRTRARRFLVDIPLTETKPVGEITARQRGRVLRKLRGEHVSTSDGWPW